MKKCIFSTFVVLSLCGSGLALAQGGPGYDRQGRGDPSERVYRHDPRAMPGPGPGRRDDYRDRDGRGRFRDHDGRDNRHMDRPGPRGHAYGHDKRYARGVGPGYAYYPGGRLPPPYRTRQYVVEDWRGHRLSTPPRGYHWVQVGADYALVAVATGIILQMLLAN